MPLRRLAPLARLAPLLLLLLGIGLSACTPHHPQSTFDPGGPVAQIQKDLYMLVFWISVVVFVLVEGALVFAILRFRRRGVDVAPKQVHGHTRLELTWTIIPALVLIFVAVPTLQAIYALNTPPDNPGHDTREVRVIAHQFWWEFYYVGEDVSTANELHIPTGEPIWFTLESDDVIHSFWVPKLAGKVDLVPQNVNRLWFQADDPGTYLGQCAEFCGIAHARMRFQVIAHPPGEFQAWLDGMRTPSPPPAPDTPAQLGQPLFAANCSMCHSVDTYQPDGSWMELERQASRRQAWLDDPVGSLVVPGPDLTHFGARETLGAGLVDLTRESLIDWIRDPDTIKIGTRMKDNALIYREGPTAALTDEQIGHIADYLLSLEPGDPDVVAPPPVDGTPEERGEALFIAQGCNSCHSVGDQSIVGPGLGGIWDRAQEQVPDMTAEEYIIESIVDPAAYIVEGYPNVMPPFRLSPQQLDDLVAYLRTLE